MKLKLLFLGVVVMLYGAVLSFAAVRYVVLQADSLPQLNIPRSGHNTFVVGGEVVVVGGHTSGFVPTATAEYFSDGAWHLVETVYPHDHGFAVPLRSGQVLIGGGHEQPLGIGHIFSVERYNPATHSFTGFGCLDRKRCFAQGVEIDSGRVVITGNWYQSGDAIELFDGVKYFTHLKEVSQPRAVPFVFRVGKDDAVIFGSMDHHADAIDTIIVDRLRGEPFRVPLFDEWRPLRILQESQGSDCFIGDEAEGRYAYLFPVENKEGQVAIAKFEWQLQRLETSSTMEELQRLEALPTTSSLQRLEALPTTEAFMLLETDGVVPMTYEGDRINWNHALTVDREAQRAYLFGYGYDSHKLFVLAVGYGDSPAALTLYCIESTGHVIYDRPVLTADGDLLLVGGVELNRDRSGDNFTPHASALLLRVGEGKESGDLSQAMTFPWLWIGGAVLALLLIVVGFRVLSGAGAAETTGAAGAAETTGSAETARATGGAETTGSAETAGTTGAAEITEVAGATEPFEPTEATEPVGAPLGFSSDLMAQIDQLMEEQQLYRRSGLKLQEVADMLNSNRTYVTDCIKSARGLSFTQYVNTYRVNYAKELLRSDLDKKMVVIATDSGFSSEVSFFRTFKTLAGVTPSEWRLHS